MFNNYPFKPMTKPWGMFSLTGVTEIKKPCRIGRLKITFKWRSKKNMWGRFGGRWNWCLGFQATKNDVVFNMLVCSLRFTIKRPQRFKKNV